jgi:hypothetical protein
VGSTVDSGSVVILAVVVVGTAATVVRKIAGIVAAATVVVARGAVVASRVVVAATDARSVVAVSQFLQVPQISPQKLLRIVAIAHAGSFELLGQFSWSTASQQSHEVHIPHRIAQNL